MISSTMLSAWTSAAAQIRIATDVSENFFMMTLSYECSGAWALQYFNSASPQIAISRDGTKYLISLRFRVFSSFPENLPAILSDPASAGPAVRWPDCPAPFPEVSASGLVPGCQWRAEISDSAWFPGSGMAHPYFAVRWKPG